MDHGGSYAVSGMRGSAALCLAQRGAPMTANAGRHGGDHAGHGGQHLTWRRQVEPRQARVAQERLRQAATAIADLMDGPPSPQPSCLARRSLWFGSTAR
jgi:hypothetical protein